MLSIIIPSRKDPYLNKTVESILANSEGEIEVICVLDGYWAMPVDDPRVRVLHLGRQVGMRGAINAGIAMARGEYLMKCDSHCMFGRGFDRLLLEEIKDNWVVIPRMYQLDVDKWEIMTDKTPNDYSKLVILKSFNKFHGEDWRSRAKQRKDIMIDETMSFQGSCWVMSHKHWDSVIGELQEEGYGPFTQEPIEIGMKTLVAGGKIMVNKKTWYAHKNRLFKRTHNVARDEADAGNTYALNKWRDFYENVLLPKWEMGDSRHKLTLSFYRFKFKYKLVHFNHEAELPDYFGPLIGEKKEVTIAELGAGPICTIGNLWKDVKVNIFASDILQEKYAPWWEKHGASPIVPVKFEDMERLSYPDNFFDIVHCVNALDHTLEAKDALEEMIRVCKPGGWIYLRHAADQRKKYRGMHEWDINIIDGECIFTKPNESFLLKELGDFKTNVMEDGLIVSTLCKI